MSEVDEMVKALWSVAAERKQASAIEDENKKNYLLVVARISRMDGRLMDSAADLIEALIARIQHLEAGLSSIVNCQSTVGRSALRGAAAEILGRKPDQQDDQSPLVAALAEAKARIAELERERDAETKSADKWMAQALAELNRRARLEETVSLSAETAATLLDRAEAAEAERDRMRAALEPFADFARRNTDEHGWAGTQCQRERICDWFGPTDFRRARAALAQTTGAVDG